MYETIVKLHSWWAFLAIIVLIGAVINAAIGTNGKKDFTDKDLRLSLFALIASHIQLLLGLILYFVSPKGFSLISEMGMSEIMKNGALRLTFMEHPLINIIAIALITIGWSKHKKAQGASKFKNIAVFYALGLALILLRIPYQSWFA